MRILILFILCFQLFAQEDCPSADPNRVVLFVDTNFSIKEVEAAARAACSNGQTLKVMPPDYKTIGRDMYRWLENDLITDNHCNEKKSTYDKAKCERAEKDYKMFDERMEKHVVEKPMPDREMLTTQIKEVSESGGKLEGMIFSGHDGGGYFSGDFGDHEISFEDLDAALKDFPEQRQSLESLYLLGCYTGVRTDIDTWKEVLPNMKLLAGYEGTAPNGYRLAGQTYIEDMLKETQNIISSQKAEDVRHILQNDIQHMFYLSAGIYIKPNACNGPSDDGEYYYRVEKTGADRFKDYNIIDCSEIESEYNSNRREFIKRFNGSYEPEDYLEGNPLRYTYKYFRVNSHCFENLGITDANKENDKKIAPAPEQVLNLLFWHNVRDNFGKYFKRDLEQMDEILKQFQMDDLEYLKLLLKVKKADSEIKTLEEQKTQLFKQYNDISDTVTNSEYREMPSEYRSWWNNAKTSLYNKKYTPFDYSQLPQQQQVIAKKHIKAFEGYILMQEKIKKIADINSKINDQRKIVEKEQVKRIKLDKVAQPKSRKQILEYSHYLTGLINDSNKMEKLDTHQVQLLKRNRDRIEKHLHHLQCVPTNWIEERDESIAAPRC